MNIQFLPYALLTLTGGIQAAWGAPSLVPQPKNMTLGTGNFVLTPKTVFVASGKEEQAEARKFASTLAPAMGFSPILRTRSGKSNNIVFTLDAKETTGDEGYRLNVTPQKITVVAAKPAGLYYATQTLRQLLPTAIYASTKQSESWTVPALSIEDAPRFKWRGLMLDSGRYFFSVEEVKKFIDTMAMHKFNTFHWHLTEDQGWRLEIKKYPKLTEVGSKRDESPKKGARNEGDGTPYGGFYTQAQAREVVAYAAARHITVVPEIEMPGHAAAAIAAYPQLGNSDIPNYAPKVLTRWGVHPYTFAPKEETFTFLEDVLREVMTIFPSAYIHVGGDEAPKTQWEQSAFAKEVMAKNNFKDGHELQSYFIKRMERFLSANGRKLIGWDEILEGGLAPNAAVMSWRGEGGAIEATNQGHPVVMSSNSAYYLDYGQSRNPNDPETIGGFVPLRRVYNFDPVGRLAADKRHLLMGVQGQLWAEYLSNYPKVEYMAYPRAAALAETGWSPAEGKDYTDFYKRTQTHVQRLKEMGVNFRPLNVEVSPAATWKSGQVGQEWSEQSWDVTPNITKAGTVEATFQYSGGQHRLDIAWAELLQNGQVIARDEHAGLTGGATKGNVYRLTLPTFIAGAKYTLRAYVRADGGNDSNGDVFVANS